MYRTEGEGAGGTAASTAAEIMAAAAEAAAAFAEQQAMSAQQAVDALGSDISAAMAAAFAALEQSQLEAGQLQGIALAETYVPRNTSPSDWEHSGAWADLQATWDYLTHGITGALQGPYAVLQAIANGSYY